MNCSHNWLLSSLNGHLDDVAWQNDCFARSAYNLSQNGGFFSHEHQLPMRSSKLSWMHIPETRWIGLNKTKYIFHITDHQHLSVSTELWISYQKNSGQGFFFVCDCRRSLRNAFEISSFKPLKIFIMHYKLDLKIHFLLSAWIFHLNHYCSWAFY